MGFLHDFLLEFSRVDHTVGFPLLFFLSRSIKLRLQACALTTNFLIFIKLLKSRNWMMLGIPRWLNVLDLTFSHDLGNFSLNTTIDLLPMSNKFWFPPILINDPQIDLLSRVCRILLYLLVSLHLLGQRLPIYHTRTDAVPVLLLLFRIFNSLS